MKNPGGDFTRSLMQYAEAILKSLDDLKQSLAEIRRDVHIQVLSSNTKLEHTHNLTNGVLNGFGDKIDKMAKAIEEIKKSKN